MLALIGAVLVQRLEQPRFMGKRMFTASITRSMAV
jgi:hypothetical protein